ncbi:MAG TPA: serine/threonine-protein kinase [Polyangia bacterium]|nr:serine/threonine-protein kinase [Polyangia bacterium]
MSAEGFLLAPGQLLAGTYRIERPLGKGGMGEVYEASHARLAGRYAVKLLLREIGQNEDVLRRFKQEAEVTSRLRHPNIVQVIDFAQLPDGAPFMVMELLEGRDLANELRAVGRLPLARVVDLVDQIASGLAAAHAEGIVHRDLKPANVFLTPLRGRDRVLAKVVDFGISKVRALTAGLTRTQTVIGTPQYMSPEQARGLVREIDERTDQFALGAMVLEMLTGEPAFRGDELSAIIYQIVYEPARTLASAGLGGMEPVEAVLARAMAKAPQDRFPSVIDFASALEAAASGAVAEPVAPSAHAGPAAAWAATTPATPALAPVSRLPSVGPSTTLRESVAEVATSGGLASSVDLRPRRGKAWLLVAVGSLAAGAAVFALSRRAPTVAEEHRMPEAAAQQVAKTPAEPAPAPPPKPPATIVVEIAGAPEGLRVQLDGRDVAVPIRLARDDQPHRLTFSAAGYEAKEQWITALEDLVVTPALEKAVAPPRPARAPKPHKKRDSDNVVTDI